MATGLAKETCCQPVALSLVKVADASFVPLEFHRLPTCVPVLAVDLKKRTPDTNPERSERNLMPTSVAATLPESARAGAAPTPQMEQVQPTVTGAPADGVSRLPLSSTARDLMVVPG